MKVLLLGKDGQLGRALVRALPGEIVGVGRQQVDLGESGALRDALNAVRPDVIVNAAAFTAVDLAESRSDEAEAINARAPGILGELARTLGAALVHFSTDYVFDGEKAAPYREGDAARPLGVYGLTKRSGEEAALASDRAVVLRTGWLW